MGLFRAPPPGRRATPGRVGRVGEDLDPTPLSFGCSISLSLSLSLLLLLLSRRVVPNHSVFSLCLSLSLSVSLSLSLCVCLTFHVLVHLGPVPLLTQTLHSSRVRLNASRVSSVCFGLFCVVCFRSMSLPRFGNLWIFPSYHLGRRTGLIKASRGGRLHRRRRSRTW